MSNGIQPFKFEGNKVRAMADGDEVCSSHPTSPRFSDTATPQR